MATNIEDGNSVTVLLGKEHDDELRAKLKEVLQKLGVPSMVRTELSFPGSGLEQWEGVIDGEKVVVEAETYIGLSISGPAHFVRRVQDLLR